MITRRSKYAMLVPQVQVFLCHNSKDKLLVKQVAEALELEFGISHFLDEFAIPTGEAFLPWIEKSINSSSGCAIFLGASGWGPTHLWEAELALMRYRSNPTFRLYPVTLPGIRDEDMLRLGSGSVFSSINWVDLRGGAIDPIAIGKLRSAFLGQVAESGRGPSALTPYVVRRDASRWADPKQADRSILYHGRKLREAESLQASQPDLMSGDAITRFLTASAAAQRALWRLVAIVAIVVVAGLAVLGVQRERARSLALSRFVAAEARQAAAPDTGLLLAVQATRISETPEAFGALIERFDAVPYLRQVTRFTEAAVTSLGFDPKADALYAGHDNGRVFRLDLHTLATKEFALATVGRILAIDTDGQDVWVGLEDGRVLVYDLAGAFQEIHGIASISTDGSVNKFALGDRIAALQLDPTGQTVAIGDHSGRLLIVGRKPRSIRWRKQLAAEVTALSFSADGRLIAAGSEGGLIQIFDCASGAIRQTRTVARRGNPKSMQFAHHGDLRVIDDSPALSIFGPGDSVPQRLDAPFLSAAVVGPRLEYGPMRRNDKYVVGRASGDILFTPWNSDDDPVAVAAHGRDVESVAMLHDGRLAATGSSDGSVAIWDLQQRSGLIRRYPPLGGEIAAMGYDPDGRLIAVSTSSESSQLFTRTATEWTLTLDLLQTTIALAGEQAVRKKFDKPDAKGFIEVEDPPVSHAAFHPNQSLAWSTRRGAILFLRPGAKPVLLRPRGESIVQMTWSESGRYLFVAQTPKSVIRFDTQAPGAPLSIDLPAALRTLAGSNQDDAVFVALDDDTIRTIDFSRKHLTAEVVVKLKGAVGYMARAGEALAVGNAGSTTGVDLGVISAGQYTRLHSRRVGIAPSAIAVSARASLIAAGDLSGRLHLWDLATRVPMASLSVTSHELHGLAISSDGKRLAITDTNGDVLEMGLDPGSWRELVCGVVRRELTPAEWIALVPDTKLLPGCRR